MLSNVQLERTLAAITHYGGSVLSFLQRLTHWEQRARRRRETTFTIAMIALSAKLARVDGAVSTEEISAFNQLFTFRPDQRGHVERLFNLAQRDVAGFDTYARQIARCVDEREMLVDVMGGLLYIANADRVLHHSEQAFLKHIATIFGLRDRKSVV